jgi:hypothetical protein
LAPPKSLEPQSAAPSAEQIGGLYRPADFPEALVMRLSGLQTAQRPTQAPQQAPAVPAIGFGAECSRLVGGDPFGRNIIGERGSQLIDALPLVLEVALGTISPPALGFLPLIRLRQLLSQRLNSAFQCPDSSDQRAPSGRTSSRSTASRTFTVFAATATSVKSTPLSTICSSNDNAMEFHHAIPEE